jgi:hypothetical protein
MGDVIRPEFGEGPKKTSDDFRRNYLSPLTDIGVQPTIQPFDAAVEAVKAHLRFKRDNLPPAADADPGTVYAQVRALAADRLEKLGQLSASTKPQAISIAVEELAAEQ